MKTEKIKGQTIEFYESIDEMPITVFHDYNRYLLVDSGIGSDMHTVDEHLKRLYTYVGKGNTKDGIQELDNLRQNIQFVLENISPKFMAGACLIKSINSKEIRGRSESEISETLRLVEKAGLNTGAFIQIIEDIKKKIQMN